jgi:hypothetical protein
VIYVVYGLLTSICDTIDVMLVSVVLDKVLLELPLVENAYCGKTNIVVNKIKSNTLRFISPYLSNSANKELLHFVQ